MEPESADVVDLEEGSGSPPTPSSPVRAIHFVPELRRVCVALHNGRMFLCDADVVPAGPSGGEGTFVMTGEKMLTFKNRGSLGGRGAYILNYENKCIFHKRTIKGCVNCS